MVGKCFIIFFFFGFTDLIWPKKLKSSNIRLYKINGYNKKGMLEKKYPCKKFNNELKFNWNGQNCSLQMWYTVKHHTASIILPFSMPVFLSTITCISKGSSFIRDEENCSVISIQWTTYTTVCHFNTLNYTHNCMSLHYNGYTHNCMSSYYNELYVNYINTTICHLNKLHIHSCISFKWTTHTQLYVF